MIVDCQPILPYRIRYIKNLCLVSVQLHHKGVAKRLYGFREGVSLRQRPLHSVHVRESLFIGASRRLITTRAPIYVTPLLKILPTGLGCSNEFESVFE